MPAAVIMPTRKRIDWPTVATALAQRISHGMLHPGAMMTAWDDYEREKRKNARHKPRWALAFSGGADSLAMLLIFWAEAPGRWGRDFVVLHFNHRLRGKAADDDEKFCRLVCAALGLKFISGRWDVGRALRPTVGGKARPAGKPKVSEAEARAARHEFFTREMKKRKIRMLWLAHQQDDIAETMLMRLSRGSGAAGMAAPRPAQALGDGRLHLRPMLTLKKAEIVAALRKAGAVWREDATNAGADFFRTRVRRSVVPAWVKASGRDALAGAALTRERLEEDDAAIEAWLDELKPLGGRKRLDVRRLSARPRALVRRALHRWLLAVRPTTDLSRQGFELLLAAVEKGKATRFSLGAKGFAVLRQGRLEFQRR
ncbi:MAG TPA: tRNA lysidine(34) synthetase TilS [Candidatus Didemnitutus sp.]|nr:tRNA lysidine(34) synthetase TilS [Candidatus Didemnitutus sp.]